MTPEERADKILQVVRLTPSRWPTFNAAISEHIRAAIREENEACARIVETGSFENDREIAAAIRARIKPEDE